MQLEDWLDDLCVRFIINLPEEDLSSVARICFQVEEAQWFYEDFIRSLDPSLPSMSLRSFCLLIFQHCPLLSTFSHDNHMQAFNEFLLYKTRVPVRGAIMLNAEMDSVVLVKGWKKGANWSFPRGKINKDEDDLDCAVREVWEETGYDIRAAGLVPNPEHVKYIEITMREQHMRLYVFRGIPIDTRFEPRTRKEISRIEWYQLSDLPAFRKKDAQTTSNTAQAAVNANKFYMVAPFLVPLKKWINQQKRKDAQHISGNHVTKVSVSDTRMPVAENGQTLTTNGLPLVYVNHNSPPEMYNTATTDHQLNSDVLPRAQGPSAKVMQVSQSTTSDSNGDALLALLRGSSQDQEEDAAPTLVARFSPQTTLQYPSNASWISNTLRSEPSPNATRTPALLSKSQKELHQSIDSTLAGHEMHDWDKFVPDFPLMRNSSERKSQAAMAYQKRPQQLRSPQSSSSQVPVTESYQDCLRKASYGHTSVDQLAPRTANSKGSVPDATNVARIPSLQPSTAATPGITGHKLALLNAFKSREQFSDVSNTPVGPSSTPDWKGVVFGDHFTSSLLPTTSRLDANDDLAQIGGAQAPRTIIAPEQRERHRSALLDMFKLPSHSDVANSHGPHYDPSQSGPSSHLGERTNNETVDNIDLIPTPTSPSRRTTVQHKVPTTVDDSQHNNMYSEGKPGWSQSKTSSDSQKPKSGVVGKLSGVMQTPQTDILDDLETAPISSTLASEEKFVGRQMDQQAVHKQNLLSLFSNSSSPPKVGCSPAMTNPLVFAHGIRKSSTRPLVADDQPRLPAPMSPADKGFLLDFLNAAKKAN